MTTKAPTQLNNNPSTDGIGKEKKKYRVVDKPQFPAIGPSIKFRQIPGWFFKTLVIAVPVVTILVVAGLVSLYQNFS